MNSSLILKIMSGNRNLIPIILAITIAGIAIISGCTKDVTVTIKPTVPVITRTVSFSKDLVPIFTSKCALAGCHVSGAHDPNLAADKAYSSLMGISNLVKVSDPSGSLLYQRLTAKINPGMPMNAPASDPSSINEYVLAWIKQGAKNN